MKIVFSKLGVLTMVAALVIAGLTFAPSAHACPVEQTCHCFDQWNDPGDGSVGGWDPGNPGSCWQTITNEGVHQVFFCGTCYLIPGKPALGSARGTC